MLVVGAGRRALGTILPAAHCMRSRVDLVGVCARRARELSVIDGEMTVGVEAGLGSVDFSAIDAVVIAIPTAAVPAVLAELAERSERAGSQAPKLTVLIDTPVLELADLGATRLFPRFARVLASEETVALPPVVLTRRLMAEGAIGPLRHVTMAHSGYRHHALASLRSLVGRGPSRVAVRHWNGPWGEVSLRFPGSVSASVLEPRHYPSGRTAVCGAKGTIVDYDTDSRHATRISYAVEDGCYVGLALDGEPLPQSELDALFTATPKVGHLGRTSLQDALKVRAFMDVFDALGDMRSAMLYDPWHAICDRQVLRLAQRTWFVPDTRLGASTVAERALRALARSLAWRASQARHAN